MDFLPNCEYNYFQPSLFRVITFFASLFPQVYCYAIEKEIVFNIVTILNSGLDDMATGFGLGT